MKAQRGSRGVSLLFNLRARWGGWSTPRPGRFTPENDPVPIVYVARMGEIMNAEKHFGRKPLKGRNYFGRLCLRGMIIQ
jgi:hypothetical protein